MTPENATAPAHSGAKTTFIIVYGISMICIGLIGNVIIIILKALPAVRRRADSTYKVGLAAADLCSLGMDMTHCLFFAFTGVFPENISKTHCMWLKYFRHTFQYIATWILVGLNFERSYAIMYPQAIHRGWKVAGQVCLGIVIAFTVWQSHYLFIADYVIEKGDNRTMCVAVKTVRVYHVYFETWFNLVVNASIPILFFLASHIFLIYRLRCPWQAPATYPVSTPPGSAYLSAVNSSAQASTSRGGSSAASQSSNKAKSKPEEIIPAEHKDPKSTLLFIFVLDMFYVLFVLPRAVYIFIVFYVKNDTGQPPYYHENMSVLTAMAATNNALKIFVYFILEESFRQELLGFFQRKTPTYLAEATEGNVM